jgi:hypothetical protein
MLSDSSKKKFANDIENRLDSFFEKSDIDVNKRLPKDSLERLKSLLLNIDWEITDDCLLDLHKEIDILLPYCEFDRMLYALLRMLQSLGNYIRKHKAQSHPHAIKLILSVYESFVKLYNDSTLTVSSKKSIIWKEINAFNELKHQISQKRPTPVTISDTSNCYIDQDKLDKAVIAVEEKFNLEVAALKKKIIEMQQQIYSLQK